MSKTILVLKNELIALVTRRSFLLALFLLPLISYSITLLVSALQPEDEPNLISQILLPQTKDPDQPEGLFDPAGLIQVMPSWVPEGRFIFYETEWDARTALYDELIPGYFRIQPDYITSGKVYLFNLGVDRLAGNGSQLLQQVINYNLLDRDESLTLRIANPMQVSKIYLSSEPQRDPENFLTLLIPYLVMILFYLVIFGSASMLLSSIAWEKQNRIMEILITSLTPHQLLTGKIIALGTVGLLQTVVWTAAGYGLLRLSGRVLEMPPGYELPASIIFWGVIFFLLGYALYASLMAGIGALVPGLREASQIASMIMTPLVFPLLMIGMIINNPNGVAAVILSLFPLTAPVTVMMRLSVASVPLWQLLLSVVILILSVIALLRFVAGLFRASNLLSGQAFTLAGFWRALRGRG